MIKRISHVAVVGLSLLVATYGCGSPEPQSPSSGSLPGGDAQADHDHGPETHGDTAKKTDMEKMTESLANFSEEDRASAMKQHICPVSDEMLGTMGAPEKVEVNGQSVWICCDGCKEKLLADPDKYLAKLKK